VAVGVASGAAVAVGLGFDGSVGVAVPASLIITESSFDNGLSMPELS